MTPHSAQPTPLAPLAQLALPGFAKLYWLLAVGLACALFAQSARAQIPQSLTLSSAIGAESRIGQEVLKEAYRRIGVQLSFKELPAERALIESNAGRSDGDLMRVEGLEATYPNLVQVPVAIVYVEGVVFAKTVKFAVSGWDSLKPYKIGTRIGLKFAENGTAGMDVTKSANMVDSLRNLEAGRVDVVVLPRIAGMEALKEGRLTDLTPLEPPVATTALYPYLHKKHLPLVPQITEVLKKMEKTGELEALRAKETAKILAAIAQNNP